MRMNSKPQIDPRHREAAEQFARARASRRQVLRGAAGLAALGLGGSARRVSASSAAPSLTPAAIGAAQRALRQTAEEILPRAKALARAEVGAEFADSIGISEETRPRGRPTAKVIADREDASDHEYGSSSTERRRLLGRAARTREG